MKHKHLQFAKAGTKESHSSGQHRSTRSQSDFLGFPDSRFGNVCFVKYELTNSARLNLHVEIMFTGFNINSIVKRLKSLILCIFDGQ